MADDMNEMMMRNGDARNLAAGAIAGMIGSLAGTFAMNQVQTIWSRTVHGFESPSAAGRHDSRDWQERYEGTNANEQAAQEIAAHTIDRPLNQQELKIGTTLVHFAFGALVGGVYGALMERSRSNGVLPGVGFGTAVWIGADEIGMPLLGLAQNPGPYPLEAHAQSFVAHLAFGVTTEYARRALRTAVAIR